MQRLNVEQERFLRRLLAMGEDELASFAEDVLEKCEGDPKDANMLRELGAAGATRVSEDGTEYDEELLTSYGRTYFVERRRDLVALWGSRLWSVATVVVSVSLSVLANAILGGHDL